mmetsp:Transcript_34323/g.83861  ORF Transcript_34323/g.83861 Transcript_34323/m.83861 type:complete len:300 (-) Transcript_34323:174-1073(-)
MDSPQELHTVLDAQIQACKSLQEALARKGPEVPGLSKALVCCMRDSAALLVEDRVSPAKREAQVRYQGSGDREWAGAQLLCTPGAAAARGEVTPSTATPRGCLSGLSPLELSTPAALRVETFTQTEESEDQATFAAPSPRPVHMRCFWDEDSKCSDEPSFSGEEESRSVLPELVREHGEPVGGAAEETPPETPHRPPAPREARTHHLDARDPVGARASAARTDPRGTRAMARLRELPVELEWAPPRPARPEEDDYDLCGGRRLDFGRPRSESPPSSGTASPILSLQWPVLLPVAAVDWD